MENWEIAAALERVGGLLAIKGENRYKVRAYLLASRQISRLEEPLRQLSAEGRLREIPGVGEALEAKIRELIDTGGSRYLDALEKEVPPELLAMYEIPGIGVKTAHKLYAGLKLKGLPELEAAAREGRVGAVYGSNVNLKRNILNFFERRSRYEESFHRGIALPLAGQWIKLLSALPGIASCGVTGDIRRGTETVTEVDLLAGLENNDGLRSFREALAEIAPADRWCIQEGGENGALPFSFTTVSFCTPSGLSIRLLLVPAPRLPAALLWSTGSAAHYEHLKVIARRLGLNLTAGGLQKQGEDFLLDGEDDIYSALELPFIPPELREGRDEIGLARQGKLPDLLELSQIKGDLHLHTNWSDGLYSIPEMAGRAAAKGYRYLAITDHSPSLQIANGLSVDRLTDQIALIKKINESGTYPCYLLAGAEVDIHTDGTLDLPDDILNRLELVVASVHSNFRLEKEEMTVRICRAMAHPAVHIIGHPTGRLLGTRGGYEVDLEKVIVQAAATGTILEINSSPQRLDLADTYLPAAKKQGVVLAINTDAHSPVTMDDMGFGVTAARRGGLERQDVVNTKSLGELKAFLAAMRNNPNKNGR